MKSNEIILLSSLEHSEISKDQNLKEEISFKEFYQIKLLNK